MKTNRTLGDAIVFIIGLLVIIFFAAKIWAQGDLLGPAKHTESVRAQVEASAAIPLLLTNNVLILRRMTNGTMEFITFEQYTQAVGVTNIVNGLVTNGTVCKVRGHKWQAYFDGHAAFYPNGPPELRKCVVCDSVQSRSWPQ